MKIILFLLAITFVAWIVSLVMIEWTTALAVGVAVAWLVGVITLIFRESGRCKNKKCRKPNAYVEVSRELYSTRSARKSVERQVYEDGRMKTIWVYEPATKYIYEIIEECRFCEHKKRRYTSETH